jgi:DNA-binding transcriptional LysR family regulator
MFKRIQDMALFAILVKNGSFTKTAAELGITKSRVSQRINRLEADLGYCLLFRTTRKISLTSAGQSYLSSCMEIIEAGSRGENVLRDCVNSPGGKVKIISPPGLMASVLPGVHRDYLKKHPDVDLQLITANSFFGFLDDDYDIAYRIGKPEDESCIGRFLGTFRRFIVCAPNFAYRGGINRPEDLLLRSLIMHGAWKSISLSRNGEHCNLAVSLSHTSDNLPYILQMTLIGSGMAILPEYIVRPLIDSGQLVTVLDDWQVQQIELWMIYPGKHNNPPVLREYINLVVSYDIVNSFS